MALKYAKLRGRIREFFRYEKEFAAKIGVSRASFSAKINGRTSFTLPEFELICQLLELNAGEAQEYFFSRRSN